MVYYNYYSSHFSSFYLKVIAMKHVIKNMFKHFINVILVYVIATPCSLHSMNITAAYNNFITIKNETNRQTLLQLQYDQTEFCSPSKKYNVFGVNTALFTPMTINCFITNDGDPQSISLLTLLDPKSKQKKVLLAAYNNDSFTIHNINKKNKTIMVTQNGREVGCFTYE